MLYSAECNGKKVEYSKGYELLSDDEFDEINKIWYSKPAIDSVHREMLQIKNGSTIMKNITKYYFSELMYNTVKHSDKWSINETLGDKGLLSIVMQKIKDSPDFYCHNDIIKNMEQVFSLGGSSFTHKAAQFPLSTVDFILEKYNVNGNWYDYSCGWGARLCGALKNGVNYFGVDPNNLLVDKLKEFKDEYDKVTMTKNNADIRCCGSEELQSDWIGEMGVAFSSPPYFDLEDYRIGNQSYKEGTSYDSWLDNYMKPTIENIYKYLISGGYFICNIKDYSCYSLEKDLIRTAESVGFELYTTEKLKGRQRVGGTPNTKAGLQDRIVTNMDENIYVFIKKGEQPIKLKRQVKVDLF